MSQALHRPDLKADISELGKRVGNLERRTTPRDTAAPNYMFSFAGVLAATLSPPVRVRGGGTLASLAVTLGTAGSTDVSLVVGRNADTVATITIPAGAVSIDVSIGVRFGPGDLLRLGIADGGGAADMTAEARF